MPWSIDAEKGVLCSLLLKPDDVLEMIEQYPAEFFYHPAHREIITALRKMRDGALPIDFVTLTEFLKKTGMPENPTEEEAKAHRGLLDKVGGAAAISELFTFVPTATNADHYIDICREYYLARRVIDELTPVIAMAYDFKCESDIRDMLEVAETKIFALGDDRKMADEILTDRQVMSEVLDAAEAAYKARGTVGLGIPSGFNDVDRMLGGSLPEELTIIAARPSQGKSAFMKDMVRYQVLGDPDPSRRFPGVAVGMFSIEMRAVDQGKRLVADLSGVELQKFRDGFFSQIELDRIARAAKRLMNGRLFIDATAGLTIQSFRQKARRMVAKHGVKIVYIDYLQLMRSTTRHGGDRQKEVAEISMLLKQTARELKIPIIALAQLNREAEGKEPTMAHLRESGQIEADADVAMFVWRPEKGWVDEAGEPYESEPAQVIIGKQRNGPTGTAHLKFTGKYTRFEDTTDKLFSNNPAKRQGGKKKKKKTEEPEDEFE